MKEARETLFRYIRLLELIPVNPGRITVKKIQEKLEGTNKGYKVSVRTLQRDLLKLAGEFPISSESGGRTEYWYWIDASSFTHLPAMSEQTALMMRFAEDYLQAVLPPTSLRILQPYFKHAKDILEGTKLDHWTKKVRIIRRGPQLIPPRIDASVQEVVYKALLEGRQLRAHYRSRDRQYPKEYLLHPQGLVVRDGIHYLVAALWDYPDVRHFPLHRMQKAELINEPARKLPEFNLQKHIEQDKEFSYPISRKDIRLKMVVDEHVALHLSESRLSTDQTITTRHDGSSVLEATVADTDELRWWLLGFGDQIEILAPKNLRADFRGISESMYDLYKT